MKIINRHGQEEDFHAEVIERRIASLATDLDVDLAMIHMRTIKQMTSEEGITTRQLDELSAVVCIELSDNHPDYKKLASRIILSDLYKSTAPTFSQSIEHLISKYPNQRMLGSKYIKFVSEHAAELNAMIDHSRDQLLPFDGIKIAIKSYLLNVNGCVFERPQYMFMRVAVALFADYGLDYIKYHYDNLSQLRYTHGSPMMYNAGSDTPQVNSCFLLGTDDSIEDILDTQRSVALISKKAGGVGVHMHRIRASGALIKSTGGTTNGLPRQLPIYDAMAKCWDQGGGKRKAAISYWIEPWHMDIEHILETKTPTGEESMKCRDLWPGLWIPDLFMKRMLADQDWSLFSHDTAPGLDDVYGDEFEALYLRYEADKNIPRKVIKAVDLRNHIARTIKLTGSPYICFKDAVNRKSNQKNIGVIKSSNLCTEIMEYSSKDSYATCNLMNLNLPIFVRDGRFDFEALHKAAHDAIIAMDHVIDINHYPVPQCNQNARDYRPLGLGIQGLANLFIKMDLTFISPEAEALDRDIMETIYHGALTASVELAQQRGSYVGFDGSPASQGILQFDMWEEDHKRNGLWERAKPRLFDWDQMKQNIKTHGLRNSLLIALMPTVSTSELLGNNESFEPFQSIIFSKKTLHGNRTCLNPAFVEYMANHGRMSRGLVDKVIQNDGNLDNTFTAHERELFKTIWDISQKDLLIRNAIRSTYVDQSTSMNIHLKEFDETKVRGVIEYSWKLGLKTGSYYFRGREKRAISNDVNILQKQVIDMGAVDDQVCRKGAGCTSCSM